MPVFLYEQAHGLVAHPERSRDADTTVRWIHPQMQVLDVLSHYLHGDVANRDAVRFNASHRPIISVAFPI